MKRSWDGTFVLDHIEDETVEEKKKEKKQKAQFQMPKIPRPLTLKSPPRKRKPTIEDIMEEFLEGITIGAGFINQIKRFMKGF
jgi:hypothetical protein